MLSSCEPRPAVEHLELVASAAATAVGEPPAAWERAAGGKAVSAWLAELADRASGWRR